MRLVKEFNLRDIKRFEIENNCSLIDRLKTGGVGLTIDLIMLGNKGISREEAYEILDSYLCENDNNSITTALEEIVKCIIPDLNSDDAECIECSSLSELYDSFCSELMSYGISFSEFWDMNTKEVYSTGDILYNKVVNDRNIKIQELYLFVCMMLQGLAGKLPKEPPQIDKNKGKSTTELIEEELSTNYEFVKAWARAKKGIRG